MESGYAKEFDIPFRLLQKPTGGLLRDMVEACGAEAESLKRIATETYEKMDEQTKYNGKLWGYKK
jgi:ATP-binding cassette, subfamily C (CFTR/MRP), member 4